VSAQNPSLSFAGQQPRIDGGPLIIGPPIPSRVESGPGRSRQNAITHGLTATTLLGKVLGENLGCHKDRLRSEWQPTSPTQEILILEMARHAAYLELAEQAEPAVMRCGATSADLLSANDTKNGNNIDSYLTAAVTSDALERVCRYRRSHEKGFHSALLRLRELKAQEQPSQGQCKSALDFAVHSEAECEAYLVDWAKRHNNRCPKCGTARCYWLALRCLWQCAICSCQFGLRAGTVMADSPLSLRCWFIAIRSLIANETISTKELAAAIGIRRLPTVRQLAARIRAALASPSATALLAGLNEVYRPST
jgi:hypothetical protein